MNSADSIEPIWYSYKGIPYDGNQPNFYDPKDFPWVAEVEANFPIYKAEIESYLENSGTQMEPYFNDSIVSRFKSWKVSVFYFWRIRKHKNLQQVPALEKLFCSIPNFVSASLSLLEPDTEIQPHNGDTNGIIRCHLGLKIPAGLPDVGFRVGDETRSWEEGKMLLFSDAQNHSAFNHSKENRFILLIDVMHPNYARKRGVVCSNALSFLWLQQLYKRMKWMSKSPWFIKAGARFCCKIGVWIYVPIQRAIRF